MQPGICQALEDALDQARKACDEYVIIGARPYFAQIMPNFGALYGEVVSNTYLRGWDRLTPAQERRLIETGWTLPDRPCDPRCPRQDHPNFTRLWVPVTPSRIIAPISSTD